METSTKEDLSTLEACIQACRQSCIQAGTKPIFQSLLFFIIQQDRFPSREALVYTSVCVVASLILYLYQRKRRKQLTHELRNAQAKLKYLQDKLLQRPATTSTQQNNKKEIRIFMDGAFDLLHYGHMNAFRLGRSLGTHLVVGVNSDDSIRQCKGAPLMNDQERLTMVSACKFVDQVVPGCPYIMNKEYIDYVIDKYQIDYVIHGDDPCIVDGKDVYAAAKAAGKYRSIPRTEGVSTTDIVGRMLLMTKEHHLYDESSLHGVCEARAKDYSLLGRQSKFLTTSRMLQLFSAGVKAPTPDMRVIYIDGAWDLFHPGHVAILKAARERGDYLIVGVHGDAVVNRVRGMNLPLMNLHERVLSVLGCRYVNDVLIDAPYEITPDMIASLNITEVVHGTKHDDIGLSQDTQDPYRHPKEAGILHVIESPSDFRVSSVVQRIQRNQEAFQAKFERKMEAERRFYQDKHSSSMNGQ